MKSSELRKKFLDFFEKRGHIRVPSSSLLPDDPSVLLTTAGMQQFKQYYTGSADPIISPHPTLGSKPLGEKNAVSIQKSFRTSDIDEVGDETHLTFFEMMGNFSFGGYFKEGAIRFSYDFLKEIGLDIEYVTIFGGDDEIPKDEESKKIWHSMGINDIREAGREDNFWGPTGNEGPSGPTTEIYINGVEIWNIVFNEYYKSPEGTFRKLDTPGVDTGMGLERLAMIAQGKKDIFETDLFEPIIGALHEDMDIKIKRVVADHTRAIIFLITDGVLPSNKEAGYILRRLMRRIMVYEIMYEGFSAMNAIDRAIKLYQPVYNDLEHNTIHIEIQKEAEKFKKSVARGLKELEKSELIDAPSAFRLYESFGLPYEIIKELGGEKAKGLYREDFDKEFDKHREASRAGQEKKFGGHGLILNTGELKAANEEELKKVTRFHTATHLLQAALRKVLGGGVHQTGSDITAGRLRFDFNFDRRLTEEERQKVEDLVNYAVERDFDMGYEEMPYEEAIKTGALYLKKEKYSPVVRVYTAQDPKTGEVFSKELCGGPHVTHTGEVGRFRIKKEESIGAGIRRIRAIVE